MAATNLDFRLSVDYWDHPKIVKLVRRLGVDAAVSHQRLLGFARKEKTSGRLDSMTNEDIAIAAKWQGGAEEFVVTLLELRLLDQPAGTKDLEIHNWAHHNPFSVEVEARREQARKAVNARWEKARAISGSDTDSNTKRYGQYYSTDTKPEMSNTHDEKRHDEKRRDEEREPGSPAHVREESSPKPAPDWGIARAELRMSFRGTTVQFGDEAKIDAQLDRLKAEFRLVEAFKGLAAKADQIRAWHKTLSAEDQGTWTVGRMLREEIWESPLLGASDRSSTVLTHWNGQELPPMNRSC